MTGVQTCALPIFDNRRLSNSARRELTPNGTSTRLKHLNWQPVPTHNLVFPLRDEQDKIAQCIVHKMIAFVETLPLFRPQDLIVAGQHDSIQDRINELPVNLKYIENILGRNAYQYKLVAHPYKSYRNMDSSMYFGFLSKNFLEFQYNRVLHNCGDAMFHMN